MCHSSRSLALSCSPAPSLLLWVPTGEWEETKPIVIENDYIDMLEINLVPHSKPYNESLPCGRPSRSSSGLRWHFRRSVSRWKSIYRMTASPRWRPRQRAARPSSSSAHLCPSPPLVKGVVASILHV